MHIYLGFMKPQSSITACNCFAIRQAARFVSQLYERHYARAGITAAQFSLLVYIAEAGKAGMADIAEAMVMDRTTLVRALKPLERDGYVVSEPEGKGSRKLLLALSAKGQQKLLEGAECWHAAQAEYVELVGAERADGLRQMLLAIPSGKAA
ncbi:MarR family winged helix-turn-helix transcriptional regulator [Pararhizobium sp. YC-54]|uniref:MarR family winged helix-turn-helix transcriptional regulator n=1 Tax=Pararhizobium sp. YC-54 TaxID=2986920 RepID=UPI0021F72E8D|nr:MarR family winged helix-turn-helix transcriptional regulator [Pararhizobium sp. YC-54]MCW0001614.1 MarR family winged helix-turn-helix transcriptional regulator [Pararhizobium sp. YC-54]